MIRRLLKNLGVYEGDAPAAHPAARAGRLGRAARRVRRTRGRRPPRGDRRRSSTPFPPERTREDKVEFRYELCNRSAACQEAVGHPRVLEVIEPLLAEDCHVIANTAWRNPADFAGGPWHCDAGPHIPRREGIPWDDRIPYPVFAIGAHIYLQDCTRSPTVRPPSCPAATVPAGSPRSTGCTTRTSPTTAARRWSSRRTRATSRCSSPTSGTAACRPSADGRGRYFLQVHYGRRDLAQRLRTTDIANQLSEEAILRGEDGTGPHARRPARSVLLRRLTRLMACRRRRTHRAVPRLREPRHRCARSAGREPARLPADRRRPRRTGAGRRAARLRRLVALR